jgi:hypothetical protein
MKTAIVVIAAVGGLIAAVLWAFASLQKVPFDPDEVDEHGMHPFAMTDTVRGRTIDVLKTADRQTRWNAYAAMSASIAAACQAASLLLSS